MIAYAHPEKPPRNFFDLVVFCPKRLDRHESVFATLDRILMSKPQLRVLMFTDEAITMRLKVNFDPLHRVSTYPNVAFVFGVVSPDSLDVAAKKIPPIYGDGWLTWIGRLQPYIPIIMVARLIWTDTLPQPFMFRQDTILSNDLLFSPIKSTWGNRDSEPENVAEQYVGLGELLLQAHEPAHSETEGLPEIDKIILERLYPS